MRRDCTPLRTCSRERVVWRGGWRRRRIGGAWGCWRWGRSDTRDALRRFFRVDAENIVAAVLAGLAQDGAIPPEEVARARRDLGLEASAKPIGGAAR